jgi:hypothetical protein
MPFIGVTAFDGWIFNFSSHARVAVLRTVSYSAVQQRQNIEATPSSSCHTIIVIVHQHLSLFLLLVPASD